jgi:hypothetical protein
VQSPSELIHALLAPSHTSSDLHPHIYHLPTISLFFFIVLSDVCNAQFQLYGSKDVPISLIYLTIPALCKKVLAVLNAPELAYPPAPTPSHFKIRAELATSVEAADSPTCTPGTESALHNTEADPSLGSTKGVASGVFTSSAAHKSAETRTNAPRVHFSDAAHCNIRAQGGPAGTQQKAALRLADSSGGLRGGPDASWPWGTGRGSDTSRQRGAHEAAEMNKPDDEPDNTSASRRLLLSLIV